MFNCAYLYLIGTAPGEGEDASSISQVKQDGLSQSGSGGNLLELPPGISMKNLQKRPSIAPVPDMFEANGIEINLESQSESESEPETLKEEDIPWGSPAQE